MLSSGVYIDNPPNIIAFYLPNRTMLVIQKHSLPIRLKEFMFIDKCGQF